MNGRVHITDVGPRDGLQNERGDIPTAAKVAFIEALVGAGVRQIEVTSFVHPRWVPAMADAEAVFAALTRRPDVRYVALVPNERGYHRALAAGCDAIALFTAASDGFARANINTTVAESLRVFGAVARRAAADGIAVRGYISTVIACPYDGLTRPEVVADVVSELLDMGCYEVSLGDTIGVGTPAHTARLLEVLLARFPADRLVMHFHDTWGMGVANVAESLRHGVRRFDASAGGLGGCPYARSATGNVATEDVLYLLDALDYETGIDLGRVVDASETVAPWLGHELPSRVHRAMKKLAEADAKEPGTC